jgi:prepilin-type N-terminal cleavage/methylation domain-containing protein
MRARGGFTLIEVLVALVVAVAAMALLAQGFTTGARQSVASQYATRAALLAQRVVTDLETGYLPSDTNQNGTFDDEPDFTYDTVSETPDFTTVSNLMKVTVNIRWKERNVDQAFVLVRLLRTGSTTGSTGSTTTPSTSPATTPKK